MSKPNPKYHNPDPQYLCGMIHSAGLTQVEAARMIGVQERTMHQYLADRSQSISLDAPYPVQYAIEGLVENMKIRLSFEDGRESIFKYYSHLGTIEDQAFALMENAFPEQAKAGEIWRIWMGTKTKRIYTEGGEATWYEEDES